MVLGSGSLISSLRSPNDISFWVIVLIFFSSYKYVQSFKRFKKMLLTIEWNRLFRLLEISTALKFIGTPLAEAETGCLDRTGSKKSANNWSIEESMSQKLKLNSFPVGSSVVRFFCTGSDLLDPRLDLHKLSSSIFIDSHSLRNCICCIFVSIFLIHQRSLYEKSTQPNLIQFLKRVEFGLPMRSYSFEVIAFQRFSEIYITSPF